MKLTREKKLRIYCVKNGHANYVFNCFGYVHCGRCEDQIGDRLGGIFNMTNMMALGHKCKTCNRIRKTLKKFDLKIVERWENKNK